jgi:lactoylglutathione lyase
VADLGRAVAFYRDVVGLPVALEIPERGATFLWVVERGQGMLGLWSLGSMPMGLSLHVAFDVALEDVMAAPERLGAQGLEARSLFGAPADEPSVLAWMPAAAVYFRDPDGHQLEHLAMIDAEPRSELGVVSWSEWIRAV